jgi:ABC-type multidrug transport system ATPase subunit
MRFEIEVGETLVIIGPNGAGKSTLLGILAGACPPTVGKILFRGLDITEHITMMHRMAGFCPQQNVFMNELTTLEWFRTLCVLRGEPDFDCSELIAALSLESQLAGADR